MNDLFYFIPTIFIGMPVLVIFILSKLGWANLASEYKFENNFTGTNIGLVSASINSVNYRNSIIIKYNSEGIYLKTIFIFILFHTPIFIPWSEIKNVKHKKVLFASFVELSIGSPATATIKLYKSTFEKFEETYILHNLGKEKLSTT